MKGSWRIRLAAMLLGIGLMTSTASAARLNASADRATNDGACTSCQGVTTDTNLGSYPAAQPLQTCNDEVCIFW